jgi:hypothetical protein
MKIYTFLPLIGYVVLSGLIRPPNSPGGIVRPWFDPPGWIFTLAWIPVYIGLGHILQVAVDHDFYDIRNLIILQILLTYTWGIAYRYSYKISLLLLMVSLLVSYIIYNTIFLSKITTGGRTTELNIMSSFIIWTTFVFSVIISSGVHGPTENVSSIENPK